MTCIKTGAYALIEPYYEVVYCDAFLIDNVVYLRIVERIPCKHIKADNKSIRIHYTIYNYTDWFDKDKDRDYGLSTLITNDYTYHGHIGKDYGTIKS